MNKFAYFYFPKYDIFPFVFDEKYTKVIINKHIIKNNIPYNTLNIISFIFNSLVPI